MAEVEPLNMDQPFILIKRLAGTSALLIRRGFHRQMYENLNFSYGVLHILTAVVALSQECVRLD